MIVCCKVGGIDVESIIVARYRQDCICTISQAFLLNPYTPSLLNMNILLKGQIWQIGEIPDKNILGTSREFLSIRKAGSS